MSENAEHRLAVIAAFKTVQLIEQYPNATDGELIAKIRAQGFSEAEAGKLCFFIPCAFARALLPERGADASPATCLIGGQQPALPLAEEPFYAAALSIATATVNSGWRAEISRACFDAVAARSAPAGSR